MSVKIYPGPHIELYGTDINLTRKKEKGGQRRKEMQLSKLQERIVHSDEKNIIVMAAAASGKTRD